MDPKDAEIERLRTELADATKALASVQHLRDLVRADEIAERKRRTRGYAQLPNGIYETLEDIGRLEGAIDALKRVWHRDDEKGHCRKGLWHLGALAMELRKRIQDYL